MPRSIIQYQIGNRSLVWGRDLSDMPDRYGIVDTCRVDCGSKTSSQEYGRGEYSTIRETLDTSGYVLVKGLIDEQKALGLARDMVSQARAEGSMLPAKNDDFIPTPLMKFDGINGKRTYALDPYVGSENNGVENVDIDAWKEIFSSGKHLSITEGPECVQFYENVFPEKRVTFLAEQSNVRMMSYDDGTPEHAVCVPTKKNFLSFIYRITTTSRIVRMCW